MTVSNDLSGRAEIGDGQLNKYILGVVGRAFIAFCPASMDRISRSVDSANVPTGAGEGNRTLVCSLEDLRCCLVQGAVADQFID